VTTKPKTFKVFCNTRDCLNCMFVNISAIGQIVFTI